MSIQLQEASTVTAARMAVIGMKSKLADAPVNRDIDGAKIVRRRGKSTFVIMDDCEFKLFERWGRGGTRRQISVEFVNGPLDEHGLSDADYHERGYDACKNDEHFCACVNDMERRGWLACAGTGEYELRSTQIDTEMTIKLVAVETGYELHFVCDVFEGGVEVEAVKEPHIMDANMAFNQAVREAETSYRLAGGIATVPINFDVEYAGEIPF